MESEKKKHHILRLKEILEVYFLKNHGKVKNKAEKTITVEKLSSNMSMDGKDQMVLYYR